MKDTSKFWENYYGSFVGAKIVSFNGMAESDLGDDGFPTFTVMFADGWLGEIEISQDPEGNGGGFISVLQSSVKVSR